jgi:hypothetical protein
MNKTPRIVNIILGVWLFISAFTWMHTPAQLTNTWIVGVLSAAIAALALADSRLRYANTALAIWLFFSTLFLPAVAAATVWNNVIVAIVMFFMSLVRTETPVRPTEPELQSE